MVNSEAGSQRAYNEIQSKVNEFFAERFEYYKGKQSKVNLQSALDFMEESRYEAAKRMGAMQMVALDAYQSIYQGHYSEMIKPVNLENIERFTVNNMKEYNEIYEAHKREMYGIIYKFTLKENGLKRVGKTDDFVGRTGGYISKARTYPSGSNKLNNFERAIQNALELLKQENKDASIDELRGRLFDYFKVEIYVTKNAIDYNGFEDLLTMYENRRDNIEYFDYSFKER